MEFVNVSGCPAMPFESADQYANQFHVIATRQTFRMTANGLIRLSEQPPLREADCYFDDDPSLGVYQESDLAPFKPVCDVIVNAVAHAPRNAKDRFKVRLRVSRAAGIEGSTETKNPKSNASTDAIIDKTLVVTGERFFQLASGLVRSFSTLSKVATLGMLEGNDWRLTTAKSCSNVQLRYTLAFGGAARIEVDEAGRAVMVRRIGQANCVSSVVADSHGDKPIAGKRALLAYSASEYNPVGTGYTTTWYLKGTACRSIAAPRVEYPGAPITAKSFLDVLNGKTGPGPAGFAAVGRGWLPRKALAGALAPNVDRANDDRPRLSPDFDQRYWNAAPDDQQCPFLAGDEIITLENLCSREHPAAQPGTGPDTVLRFVLPGQQPFLILKDRQSRSAARMCNLDTVYIDPEKGIVELVWRAAVHMAVGLSEVVLMLASTDDEKQALQKVLQIQGG
jgi:hypothetical protein